MIRNTQLACFFDTGCRAEKVISCTPGFRLASSRVPQVGFDRTYRNQSRSVAGWSKVTNASSPPGGNSAMTSFGHSKRGLLYPVAKDEDIRSSSISRNSILHATRRERTAYFLCFFHFPSGEKKNRFARARLRVSSGNIHKREFARKPASYFVPTSFTLYRKFV